MSFSNALINKIIGLKKIKLLFKYGVYILYIQRIYIISNYVNIQSGSIENHCTVISTVIILNTDRHI